MSLVLAVDLGGTKICSALVGEGGEVLRQDVRPTEASLGQQRVIDNILSSLRAVTPPGTLGSGIRALGVGAPGPLDPQKGEIIFAPNLQWRNVNLRQILEDALGIPVFLENDANLAALGEHLYGAGRGHDHMVFLTVSTGVGGGLILNGEIYSGAYGGAGEVGHIVVAPDGPPCSCGNRGCLEAVASGRAIRRMAAELISSGGGKGILELAGGDPSAVDAPLVTQAAQGGDPEAGGILETAGRYLGMAIASVCTLLNPSLFVIGGGVARGAGKLLLRPAEDEALRRVLPAFRDSLRIAPAALLGRAGILGAAAYARRKLREGEIAQEKG